MTNSLKYAMISLATLSAVNTAHAQSALHAGFVENADVFIYMDIAGMNTSAFSKAVEAQQTPEAKALADEKTAKFTAATGLSQEDVISMAFSMDIDNIDFEAKDPAELEKAQAVLAFELGKPITLEQAKTALETMGDESEMDAKLSIVTVEGIEVIKLESKDNSQGPDGAFGTISPDGKTFLMAFNTMSLKDGLARIGTGAMSDPTPAMIAAMQTIGNSQARMVLVLPPQARQKVQEGIQATVAQGGMGAMIAPFATAKSLIISANAGQNLDFGLSLDLDNPGNATQASGMIQGMLPMLSMGLGPDAMGMIQKMKVSAEQSVISLKVAITPADVKKMTGMGAGMGM